MLAFGSIEKSDCCRSFIYKKIFGINECHTFDMISPSLNKNSFAVDIKNLLKLFHTYRV